MSFWPFFLTCELISLVIWDLLFLWCFWQSTGFWHPSDLTSLAVRSLRFILLSSTYCWLAEYWSLTKRLALILWHLVVVGFVATGFYHCSFLEWVTFYWKRFTFYWNWNGVVCPQSELTLKYSDGLSSVWVYPDVPWSTVAGVTLVTQFMWHWFLNLSTVLS